MLAGKKVLLRAYDNSVDDGWDVVKWRNNPQVKPFFFEEEPLSLDAHFEWVEKITHNLNAKYYMIQLVNEADPAFGVQKDGDIGTIGLNHIDWRSHTAELSWFLIGEVKYRSWGYGTEAVFLLLDYAFNHLNLNKIGLYTMALNEGARAVYQKMGFQEEGVLREQKFKNGQYIDVHIYGLLREDFNDLKKENLIGE